MNVFAINPDSAVAMAAKSEEQTFHSEAMFYEVQVFKCSRVQGGDGSLNV
jgi:hypothetical protein